MDGTTVVFILGLLRRESSI